MMRRQLQLVLLVARGRRAETRRDAHGPLRPRRPVTRRHGQQTRHTRGRRGQARKIRDDSKRDCALIFSCLELDCGEHPVSDRSLCLARS